MLLVCFSCPLLRVLFTASLIKYPATTYKSITLLCLSSSVSPKWAINQNSQITVMTSSWISSRYFSKTSIAERKNEIYRKKCYLNHGESKAVFGNNDTPIGRNDSTCGNVFSLCLNDSRHTALPIGFMRVHGQQARTCMRAYAQ